MPIEPAKAHEALKLDCGSPLLGCCFDPQGKWAFAGAQDNSILRWDIAANQKTVLRAHDSWVQSFACPGEGGPLISGGYDGRLIWWPVTGESPQPTKSVAAHQGWVRCLATSPDRKFVLSGGNDRLAKLWHPLEGTLIRDFSGHDSHVYSVAFHPQGEFAVTGDLHGHVHQWEIATGKLVRSFDAKPLWTYNGGQGVDFGGVRALAISPDGKTLAAGGLHNASNPLGAVHDPTVLLFDWDSLKQTQQHVAEGIKGAITRLVFHPEGWLIGGSGGTSGGHLHFWKPDQPKEAHRYKLPNTVRDFDLHPDQQQILTAHYDQQLRVTRLTPKPG